MNINIHLHDIFGQSYKEQREPDVAPKPQVAKPCPNLNFRDWDKLSIFNFKKEFTTENIAVLWSCDNVGIMYLM